ncbi:MAG: ABC transporter ATP-binding protein [Anaerolineae bacterium]|nr:MAG: ABC transporter ATP-binding protein [Anaerolineae bacterium]
MLVTILVFISAFTEGFSVLLVLPMLEGLGQETQTVSEGNRLLQWINELFRDVPENRLLQTAAILFVALTIARTAFSMLAISVQAFLQARLDRQLREEVYNQILSISYEDLNQRRDSDWQMILNSETGRAAGAVFGLVSLASGFITIFIYVLVLLAVSWQMTLLAAGLLVLVFFLLGGIVRLAGKIGQYRYDIALAVQYSTLETLNAKRIIRIMHQQEYERKSYFSKLKIFQRALIYLQILNEASRQLLEVIVIGLLALMLIIGGAVLNVNQTELIPIVSTFILILYRMMPHVLNLNAKRTSISADLAAVKGVVDVLERGRMHYLKDGTIPFHGIQKNIVFRDVCFQYTKREALALRDIRLEINKGEKVALVGSSGSGKSTMADMLTRLYDPKSGQVLIDGHDLRDLRLGDWIKHIGVVSQDTFVFNETISYNIGYGTPDVTQAQIEEAARNANIHQFIIEELPEGYNTRVGDRGVLLSGGQRQRIAIARAILRDPEVLILDEATSALDSENERLIQTALDRLSQNRTVLVIAHRLSTILNSDKIVVMELGRIVEVGTHNELLMRGGRYAELYHSQFQEVPA